MKTIIASLLLCTLATLHSKPFDFDSVLATDGEKVGFGFVLDPVYFITDKSGELHSGVTVGDENLSVIIPFGEDSLFIRSRYLIIGTD